MRKVYPRIPGRVYAVISEDVGNGRAKVEGLCAVKRNADRLKASLKRQGKRHVIVVPYSKESR